MEKTIVLNIRIEGVANGYIVWVNPPQDYMQGTPHIAPDVQSLGLLVKQLAGEAKHKEAQLRRNK